MVCDTLAETEIAQFDRFFAQENVLGPYVSMNNVQGMNMIKSRS